MAMSETQSHHQHHHQHLWHIYFDWALVVGLLPVNVVLTLFLPPFQQFVSQTQLSLTLDFPLQPNPLPWWSLLLITTVAPALVLCGGYLIHRDRREVHHAVLGLSCSLELTWLVTILLQCSIGRPTPNFINACYPSDEKPTFSSNGNVVCTVPSSQLHTYQKSFPSTDAALASAGLGFLALYLAWRLQLFDGEGRMWKLVVSTMPALGAALVAVTPFRAYWAHWTDVLIGALVGCAFATLCFARYFLYSPASRGYTSLSGIRVSSTFLSENTPDSSMHGNLRNPHPSSHPPLSDASSSSTPYLSSHLHIPEHDLPPAAVHDIPAATIVSPTNQPCFGRPSGWAIGAGGLLVAKPRSSAAAAAAAAASRFAVPSRPEEPRMEQPHPEHSLQSRSGPLNFHQ